MWSNSKKGKNVKSIGNEAVSMPLFGVAETEWHYCGVRGKVGGNPYHIRCVLKHVEPK